MENLNLTNNTFQKSLGYITLLSGLLAFLCNILIGLAINFNFEIFKNPSLLFESLTLVQATYFRWSMILDIWGYYLLLAPAVLFLYIKMNSPWRMIYACSGLAYVLIGAIGAAILAATGSHYLQEYLMSAVPDQAMTKNNFLLVFSIVNDGMWNLLEMGLCGLFMYGASAVIKTENKGLYYLTLLLAASGILDSLGNTVEWHILSEIGLNVYLLLAPIWAIWIGIRWIKNK